MNKKTTESVLFIATKYFINSVFKMHALIAKNIYKKRGLNYYNLKVDFYVKIKINSAVFLYKMDFSVMYIYIIISQLF